MWVHDCVGRTRTRIRGGFAKVRTDSHRFAMDSRWIRGWIHADSRMGSPGFPKIPQDSPGFPRIPQDSPGFPMNNRTFADSRIIRTFAWIRESSRRVPPIRGRIHTDSQGFAKVHEQIRTDTQGFTPDNRVTSGEFANWDGHVSTLLHVYGQRAKLLRYPHPMHAPRTTEKWLGTYLGFDFRGTSASKTQNAI